MLPRKRPRFKRSLNAVVTGRIKEESKTYDNAPVDLKSSELQIWDSTLYSEIVREYEYSLVQSVIDRSSPRTVLDVGCGPGWLSQYLSMRVARTVGVDVSMALLTHAKRNSSERAAFVLADACRLPLASGSIDLAICMGALHHLPPKETLGELRRVLGRGGELLLFEPNALNLIAMIGRRVFPTEVHTANEVPFNPLKLSQLLSSNDWKILHWETRFYFVFVLSRIFKIIGTQRNLSKRLLPLVARLEDLCTSSGVGENMGWIIACVARPGGTFHQVAEAGPIQ